MIVYEKIALYIPLKKREAIKLRKEAKAGGKVAQENRAMLEMTENEKALLKLANIPIGDVTDWLSGYNRLVVFLKGGEDVVKIKRMPLDDATEEFNRIDDYHHELVKCGVSVPEIIQLSLILDRSTRAADGTFKKRTKAVVLVERSSFLGAELGNLLRSNGKTDYETLLLIRTTLDHIFRPLLVLLPEKDGMLKLGLDPLLRNVVLNGSGKVFYVDLFPAKIQTEDGERHLEYPAPEDDEAKRLGWLRHYDPAGILFVFYIDACRTRPDLQKEFKDLILNYLARDDKLRDLDLAKYMESSPAAQLTDDAEANAELVDSLDGRGISYFFLRDLACELAARFAPEDNEFTEAFFKATHFQSEPMDKEEIEAVKDVLRTLIGSVSDDRNTAFAQAKDALLKIASSH